MAASLVDVLSRVYQGIIDEGAAGSRLLVMFVHVGNGNLVSQSLSAHPGINAILVATEPRGYKSFGVPSTSDLDAVRDKAVLPFKSRCTEVRLPLSIAIRRFANAPDCVVFCDHAKNDELAIVREAYPSADLVCPCDGGFDLIG